MTAVQDTRAKVASPSTSTSTMMVMTKRTCAERAYDEANVSRDEKLIGFTYPRDL